MHVCDGEEMSRLYPELVESEMVRQNELVANTKKAR